MLMQLLDVAPISSFTVKIEDDANSAIISLIGEFEQVLKAGPSHEAYESSLYALQSLLHASRELLARDSNFLLRRASMAELRDAGRRSDDDPDARFYFFETYGFRFTLLINRAASQAYVIDVDRSHAPAHSLKKAIAKAGL